MATPTERKTPMQRFRVPLLLVGTVVLLIAARGLDALVSGEPVLRFSLGIGAAAGAIFAYTWLSRRVENRWEVTQLAAMLLAVLFTDADVASGSFGACLGVAGSMASVAVTEELLFRGVVHRILEERTGSIVAIAVSSLIFGLTLGQQQRHAVGHPGHRGRRRCAAGDCLHRHAVAVAADRPAFRLELHRVRRVRHCGIRR